MTEKLDSIEKKIDRLNDKVTDLKVNACERITALETRSNIYIKFYARLSGVVTALLASTFAGMAAYLFQLKK